VVYGVEVAGNDGKTHEVKVDAGNAQILSQQVLAADEPATPKPRTNIGRGVRSQRPGDEEPPGPRKFACAQREDLWLECDKRAAAVSSPEQPELSASYLTS
jgi:hypothetical protein